jgi:hypothetical protein
MATATKTATETDIPQLAEQIREQLVSTVRQGNQLTVEAVQAWTKAASALPTPELPGLASLPSTEAATTYAFDLAIDLLKTQRDFALQVAAAITPSKTA